MRLKQNHNSTVHALAILPPWKQLLPHPLWGPLDMRVDELQSMFGCDTCPTDVQFPSPNLLKQHLQHEGKIVCKMGSKRCHW